MVGTFLQMTIVHAEDGKVPKVPSCSASASSVSSIEPDVAQVNFLRAEEASAQVTGGPNG